jgi:hypothetical protein
MAELGPGLGYVGERNLWRVGRWQYSWTNFSRRKILHARLSLVAFRDKQWSFSDDRMTVLIDIMAIDTVKHMYRSRV